ncbi:MAG: efflux RND transporter periplasmic adaptor subunit [Deferribacteres bacterium]|nr:efflux RND transporter periplasmic adaptor subunit [candidate division KSB1 bacterium]MCB9503163.1 efflux RND transporter periplasmic adaptor subunit [Deferribacteres bacterium]
MKRIQSAANALFNIFLLVLFLTSCESEPAHEEGEEAGHEGENHSEIVQLSPQELDEFGIELATAGPGKLNVHVSLPGEIIIPTDNLAHIHPRFPGMVKKVFKHIGDFVKKGETLAIIEGNESLAEYKVKSLIDGTIVEKHLSLGEIVQDSEHGFVIADLSHVWAMLKLYQKDLPYVKIGQQVTISAGQELPKSKEKIAYISPILDEITRTAEARIVLKNSQGHWKPGLFVNGEIITSDVEVSLIAPKTALELYENQNVIFVQTNQGFIPRVVQIGRTNEVSVEIISGLKTGETFVSKGGFTIKAELQKSELGDDHGH